jgi:hypothetical protein
MKALALVGWLGVALLACGSPEVQDTAPLQEPCMEAPDESPAPAWDGHTLCHLPPGNPANAHTITVGAPAVRAHLAHGDTIGACGGGGGGGGGPGECLPAGATCSNSECCVGLFCVTSDGATSCNGAAGCSCQILIN